MPGKQKWGCIFCDVPLAVCFSERSRGLASSINKDAYFLVNGKRKVEHKPESNNNPSEHIAC
jgi:hypothetical protein